MDAPRSECDILRVISEQWAISLHMISVRLVLVTMWASIAVAFAEKERPNIVVIFADDLGYGDLSCYGASKIKTPNLDQLASAGMKFSDAHSAASLCWKVTMAAPEEGQWLSSECGAG